MSILDNTCLCELWHADSNRWFRLTAPLLYLLALAGTASAQIVVEGIKDKTVYADRVTFVVQSEEGFNYTAELNGQPIATDVAIEVRDPEYYQLSVHRREVSTGAEDSLLIQFIVRASARGDSEWGLPPWTPYPLTNSADSEFTGARLKIVMPPEYPMGLEIPVIARVENESGKRLGVNGAITAAEFPDEPLQLFRGVGSVFLPPAAEPNALTWIGQIGPLEAARTTAIEASTDWQNVSEDILTSTDWGQNARIRIHGGTDETLTVGPDATLTVGAGSVIVVDPDVDIAVEGSVVVEGTVEQPVVFTSADRNVPWGGFVLQTGGSEGTFAGTILTASGADPEWIDRHPGYGHSHRPEQCLFFLRENARLTLTDCFLVDNHGQAGHGESAYLTMTGCLVQKCITAGQYNAGAVVMDDCALIEFPSATAPFVDEDNDALYMTGGAHALTDCLVGWALDDGIDAGSGAGGSVTVKRCWIEACYHEGMAWSESRDADVTDTVAINCGQGIECGFGSPDVNAVNILCTGNSVGARFGDCYDWTYGGFLSVHDSLLLFNARDVWGRAWDNWTVHLSQMDIRDNLLSAANANYPDNALWDPQADPNQLDRLAAFLPTGATTVGVALTATEEVMNVLELPSAIGVHLSTFTTNAVSVDYAIETDDELLDSGTLRFSPGQTVQQIGLDNTAFQDLGTIHVTLSNPVNAELTGPSETTYYNMAAFLERLVVSGDDWAYFKGIEEPPADWNTLSFDDTSWLSGPTPIGYENGSGYEDCIATDLNDMRNNYLSVYARREFLIEDPSQLTALTLTMDFDDGYIVYLNGVQVAAYGAPDTPGYDQPASTSHEACCGSCDPTSIDLTEYIDILVPGTNVLAVEAHNRSLTSSDFLFVPELVAVTAP